jgi:asparagine synthase (glutamine-hydrolysing)
MCGILAVFGSTKMVSEPEAKKGLDQIHHRGPDDYGLERFDNAILGFRRLSIIDLSRNGHQPMTDASRRYWIVFNGEIYNYKHLRDQLIKEGVTFASSADTEVILYGYIKYGDKIVELLDGMFSFVIYDSLTDSVFTARDRMGKKPMLMYQNEHLLVLFSELKQIISFSFFDKQINRKVIPFYLNYGAIPSPMTIFENVNQLEAGYYATFVNGKLIKTQYWKPQVNINNQLSYEEALRKTHDLVVKSITKRMISDVPLGAFLSGGIDSSIITAVMANHSNNVKTFSIQYADAPQSYDESYYAGLIVKQYDTKHTSITISSKDIYDDIENIVWQMDQPSGDAINTYFVSKSAKLGVTVSLSGIGGDEIFAGYSTFKFANALAKIRPASKSNNGKRSIADKAFFNLPASYQVNWKVRLMAGLLGAFRSDMDRYNLIKELYRNDEIQKITQIGLIDYRSKAVIEKYFDPSLSYIQQISLAEVNNYLKNTLLRDADVMGMAHSLEIRCPFIDHQLIEHTLNMPDHYKIKNLGTKLLLKDAFKSYLPEEIINRKKMGFAFPLSNWLKTGRLKELVEDCLSEASVVNRGLFNYEEIRVIKDTFFMLKKDSIQTYQSYQKVWLLVVLEMWFRRYLN